MLWYIIIEREVEAWGCHTLTYKERVNTLEGAITLARAEFEEIYGEDAWASAQVVEAGRWPNGASR